MNFVFVWKMLGGKVWEIEAIGNDENVAAKWNDSAIVVSLTFPSLQFVTFDPSQNTSQWRLSLEATVYIHDLVKYSRNRRLLSFKEDQFFPKNIRFILEQGSYYTNLPPAYRLKVIPFQSFN